MKPDTTSRSDLEIARATIADAINRNTSGIAATAKPAAPFVRDADYKANWSNYWTHIVAPDGEVNLDQVQRELSDYGRLLDAVPLVYMHATGGLVSKPLTDPSAVCSLIDDHVSKIVEDAVKDSELLQLGPGAIHDHHHTAQPHEELLPNSDQPRQHPDDDAVDRFAAAMKAKLADARAKGRHGRNDPEAVTDAELASLRQPVAIGGLSGDLFEMVGDQPVLDGKYKARTLAALMTQHMTKGNPGTFEDVANYCMFLHQRGADPITLASAAFYTPTTNFQRNTLLAAMKEVREALQHAVKPPHAAITDTVWMLNRPETLFDFIDATLEGLVEWHAPGARNMLYAGLFDGESEEDRIARLDLAHAMMQSAEAGG